MRQYTVTFDLETDDAILEEEDIRNIVKTALYSMPLEPYIDFSDIKVELVSEGGDND